jgi:hypothetical protein
LRCADAEVAQKIVNKDYNVPSSKTTLPDDLKNGGYTTQQNFVPRLESLFSRLLIVSLCSPSSSLKRSRKLQVIWRLEHTAFLVTNMHKHPFIFSIKSSRAITV